MPSSDCHSTRFTTVGGGSHQSYGTRDVYVAKLAVATGRRSTGSTALVRRWHQNWIVVWCGIEILQCFSTLVCSTSVKDSVYFHNVVLFGKRYSSDTYLSNCWKLPTRKATKLRSNLPFICQYICIRKSTKYFSKRSTKKKHFSTIWQNCCRFLCWQVIPWNDFGGFGPLQENKAVMKSFTRCQRTARTAWPGRMICLKWWWNTNHKLMIMDG